MMAELNLKEGYGPDASDSTTLIGVEVLPESKG